MGRHRVAACAILLAIGATSWAQQAPPVPPTEAQPAAAEAFQAVSQEQLHAARAKLQADLSRLDRLLGTSANGQAWRKFLLWDQLHAQIAPEAKLDIDLLEEIRHRLLSRHPGLNLPAFAAVARSFADFEQAALAAAPESDRAFSEALRALTAARGTLSGDPLAPQFEDAAAALRWLALRGQAPELVKAVRQEHGRPNFYFFMSEPFLAVGMERKVNRTEPVTDNILGTRIHGMGSTSGYVRTQLVPHPTRAVVDSLFDGTTYSRTVGRNGPATIHSAGRTDFQVRKRFYLDPDGMKTVPATASARTSTRTLSVDSGRGGWLLGHIADNIARNRVAQNKSRSEAIGADHAEDRLMRRVDDEARPELADTNKDYQDKFRYPLLEAGQFPADMRMWTTDYYLYGKGTEANRLQFAAPDKPVALTLPSDLGLQIHHTAITNLADGALAGDTVTQTDFEKWIKDRLGRIPDRLQRGPDEDVDWVMTFSRERPVRITFGDNVVSIALHVDRLEGRTPSERPWIISAVYHLEPIPGGMKGVRQGEVQATPVGYAPDAKLPGPVIAEAANIQRQFGKSLLEPEIIHDGLELTGDWEKLGKLPLIEFLSHGGWLNLSWRKP